MTHKQGILANVRADGCGDDGYYEKGNGNGDGHDGGLDNDGSGGCDDDGVKCKWMNGSKRWTSDAPRPRRGA